MSYDIKAKISFTNPEYTRKLYSGIRPAHDINGYLTTGVQEFIGTDSLKYGETTEGYITFISPEYYPKSLKTGKIIPFYDGPKFIGTAEVIEIYNKTLEE
ncbi:MAG: hypothetical protein IJR59_02515 [Firmicutes bacterium]|nr:hypothetical protein [Bacillota bacterium]